MHERWQKCMTVRTLNMTEKNCSTMPAHLLIILNSQYQCLAVCAVISSWYVLQQRLINSCWQDCMKTVAACDINAYHSAAEWWFVIPCSTRWLYCVECPQYITRRRSTSNIHRSGMLHIKQVGMERPSNIISLHRKIFFNYYEYSTNY